MWRLSIFIVVGLIGCGAEPEPTPPALSIPSASNNAPSSPNTAKEIIWINGITLSPMSLLEDKISMLIPDDFTVMDPEVVASKYPDPNAPTVVYTNKFKSVNVAINDTNQALEPSELAETLTEIKSALEQSHSSTLWYKSELITIHEREWILLEFRSHAIDTDIRNFMLVTSVEGKQLMLSFNTILELEKKWIEPIETMIHSIEILPQS